MQLAPSAALVLLLGGCMDHLMEAPYVLATGLGEVNGLVPSTRGTLLAATPTGTWEVDETGARTLLSAVPSQSVAIHRERIYALSGERILWGTSPAPAGGTLLTQEWPAPGTVDIQAWCDGLVLMATPDDILVWSPDAGTVQPWKTGLTDIRHVALREEPTCEGALVLTDDALYDVGPGHAEALATGLSSPRAVAVDAHGEPWFVEGEPPVLSHLVDGKVTVFARYLDSPTDLHFGTGLGLMPSSNLYIADHTGTIEYVHMPEAPIAGPGGRR